MKRTKQQQSDLMMTYSVTGLSHKYSLNNINGYLRSTDEGGLVQQYI